jgi:hypothetical protein
MPHQLLHLLSLSLSFIFTKFFFLSPSSSFFLSNNNLIFSNIKLERRHAADVREVGQQVVPERIGDVIRQVLHWPFAGDDRLHHDTEKRHHRQSAVFDLLHLHRLHVVLTHAHRVERAARVRRVAGAAHALFQASQGLLRSEARVGVFSQSVDFDKVHQAHHDPEQRRRRRPEVVGALRRDDTVLKPNNRGGVRDETLHRFRGSRAGNAKHGPSAVDNLGVRQPRRVNETAGAFRIGQTERIKTVVTRQGAVQVGQGLVGDAQHVQRCEVVRVSGNLLLVMRFREKREGKERLVI